MHARLSSAASPAIGPIIWPNLRRATQPASTPSHKAGSPTSCGQMQEEERRRWRLSVPVATISMRNRVERLAAGVLDVLGPGTFDGAHNGGRHRHEVEVFGHLAAL